RHNLAYTGTTVATGEALGIVIATGMNTELGRIASLSQAAPNELSPLQHELRHIATYVTYGVVALSLVLLIIAIQADLAFKDALLFAVGFASSLIPQGLPAEVNTSLAQAAGKLSRAKALVKKLSAVETLGATHVICTDKTGTLTKNEMTVQELLIGATEYSVTGTGYEPIGKVCRDGKELGPSQVKALLEFIRVGLFASNARLLKPDKVNSQWRVLGDPTEAALMTLAAKVGLDNDSESTAMPEIRELTFDSARKRMTSIRAMRNSDTGAIAYVKGAPENVLEQSSHIMIDGVTRPLTQADRDAFLAVHTKRAKRALRNLAFATRPLSMREAKNGTIESVESGLTLLGMVSMIDPIRDAVPAAMKAAQEAHIKVNVVTGDFSLTAQAIARQAGLGDPDKDLVVITGEELALLPDEVVLRHALAGGTIFSRVNPEDKMRIVDLIKKSGHIVAVTGDGINDAPALRHANIGVAMGIAGTDVAKQAAEVILLDDSFSTMVGAIRQGRTIFVNIKKGVLSCFTSNAAELVVNVASLVLASMFGIPLAINVLQILAVDLLAELFPIAALGWDKEEGETMKQQPRDPKRHILNGRSIGDLLWCGLIIGGLSIVNYLLFFGRAGVDPASAHLPTDILYSATTITYVTIVICQLVNIIQRRSVHGFFSKYQLSNRNFWLSICLSFAIILSISYVPAVSDFFKSGPLSGLDWLFVIGAASIFLAIRELQRLLNVRTASSTAR
ncbi:cation-transporting P-type ATPase, partial [Candidatus Saccharibacteria bacterium]|nr:cation-transporting P-type ATPase [Candidatus Saccharibacteria bacterium]